MPGSKIEQLLVVLSTSFVFLAAGCGKESTAPKVPSVPSSSAADLKPAPTDTRTPGIAIDPKPCTLEPRHPDRRNLNRT